MEDCRLVKEVIKKDKALISWFKALTSSMEITSTYRVPYYLQKRKWQSIQRRLSESNDDLCIQASIDMNNRDIRIRDKDLDFYNDPEVMKMKEF